MKTEIIQKLKSFGVDDQSAEEMYELLSQEVVEVLFEDLAEKSTDEELQAIEERIKNAKSPEHFETIISEIAQTVYEDNAEQEIKNVYLDLVDSVAETIKQANELLQRANAGDPDAQRLLAEAQNSQTYKNIMGGDN
jgi:DNA polymerase III gamma/tau subunit